MIHEELASDSLEQSSHSNSGRSRRRLLLISCHFPPVGGAGVQRPVKFVKYLREFGWEPTVLTVENPSVPAFDESLCADIPEGLRIERAKTWEPGYQLKKNVSANTDSQQKPGLLSRIKSCCRRGARRAILTALQPDPQVLWMPHAKKAGAKILRETPHDAIMVTAPPYSAFLTGAKLGKKFGLPLLLDYRDEWDISSQYLENGQQDWFSRVVQTRMQRSVLRQANLVLATTKASAAKLEDRVKSVGSSAQTSWIYNGFDVPDFEKFHTSSPVRTSAPTYRLVYTGTLWNLTTVEPIARAMELLRERNPAAISNLEFVFLGRKTTEQEAFVERISATGCKVETRGYSPHAEILQSQSEADGLLLLLSDVPSAERVVPAKLFEYLAMRKEILGVTPAGETSELLSPFFPESLFSPANIKGIATWLETRAAGVRHTVDGADWDQQIRPFTRREQTRQLAGWLDSMVMEPESEATQ